LSLLTSLLAEPLTRGLDVDDPKTTELRLQILQNKPFVRRIYDDWYRMICARIPAGSDSVLELGSGSGYFGRFLSGVIQSEVFFCSNVDLVADACHIPFRCGSLRAIVMTDVFHHIPSVDSFLSEANRCLHVGGRIVMVEPWVSHWSRVIWRLHPEPFQPESSSWDIPRGGPLSGANIALPWIVFVRDRSRLLALHPEFEVKEVIPFMPFSFLISGGLSMKSLLPAVSYGLLKKVESILTPWMNQIALFALFAIEKIE
jgi:SAM-dependent methyltransferase